MALECERPRQTGVYHTLDLSRRIYIGKDWFRWPFSRSAGRSHRRLTKDGPEFWRTWLNSRKVRLPAGVPGVRAVERTQKVVGVRLDLRRKANGNRGAGGRRRV